MMLLQAVNPAAPSPTSLSGLRRYRIVDLGSPPDTDGFGRSWAHMIISARVSGGSDNDFQRN